METQLTPHQERCLEYYEQVITEMDLDDSEWGSLVEVSALIAELPEGYWTEETLDEVVEHVFSVFPRLRSEQEVASVHRFLELYRAAQKK